MVVECVCKGCYSKILDSWLFSQSRIVIFHGAPTVKERLHRRLEIAKRDFNCTTMTSGDASITEVVARYGLVRPHKLKFTVVSGQSRF